MKLILLIVTVLGVGGPPGLRLENSDVLPNATITVVHKGKTVADSTGGELSVKLKPGIYSVIAKLADEAGKPPNLCETTTIDLKRTTKRLKMECSIS